MDNKSYKIDFFDLIDELDRMLEYYHTALNRQVQIVKDTIDKYSITKKSSINGNKIINIYEELLKKKELFDKNIKEDYFIKQGDLIDEEHIYNNEEFKLNIPNSSMKSDIHILKLVTNEYQFICIDSDTYIKIKEKMYLFGKKLFKGFTDDIVYDLLCLVRIDYLNKAKKVDSDLSITLPKLNISDKSELNKCVTGMDLTVSYPFNIPDDSPLLFEEIDNNILSIYK